LIDEIGSAHGIFNNAPQNDCLLLQVGATAAH
jgi:hypothetical protein